MSAATSVGQRRGTGRRGVVGRPFGSKRLIGRTSFSAWATDRRTLATLRFEGITQLNRAGGDSAGGGSIGVVRTDARCRVRGGAVGRGGGVGGAGSR
jgi:hypothetical protein